MQRRLDATVTHLITVETTGVRERQVCLSHSGKDSRHAGGLQNSCDLEHRQ